MGINVGLAVLLLLPLAVQCFLGYRLFRILTAIVGFVVGGAIGGVLGYLLMQEVGAILVGLLIGLLGGFLAFKLYKLGVFVMCFGAGAVIGGALGLMAGGGSMVFAFAGIAGIALGVLGVILTKPIIIISTAAGGGMGAGMMLGIAIGHNTALGLIFGIVLAIAGILVQFRLEKKPAKNAPAAAGAGGEGGKKGFSMPQVHLPKVSLPKGEGGDGAGGILKGALGSLKTGAAAVGQKVGSGVHSAAASPALRRLRGEIDTTKTTHPLPGWNELMKAPAPLWTAGSPVAVNEARIVTPADGSGGVSLALGLQNLSGQAVLGAFFTVTCFDLLRQEVAGIEKLGVQDFRLERGQLWFSQRPFALPDANTRWVELTVTDVVFADGSIWHNEERSPMEALPEQAGLTLPQEEAEELFLTCEGQVGDYAPGKIFRYQPAEAQDHWFCACGQLNTGEKCVACGMTGEELFGLLQPGKLAALRQDRLAREAQEAAARQAERERLEAERRQKLAEQTEAAKQKAAEAGAQAAEAMKKGADKASALGRQATESLSKGGKAAGTAVAAHKREILLVLCAFVAAAAICVAAVVGFRALNRGEEKTKTAGTPTERVRPSEKPVESLGLSGAELTAWEAQFLLPYSDQEPVQEADLTDMSESDLILAKYEILARHGRRFDTPALAEHFEAQPWYRGTVNSTDFNEGVLSEVERANFALIDTQLQAREAAQAAAQAARVARALLAKLEECPAFDPLGGQKDSGIVPLDQLLPTSQDGTYYWTGIGEDPGDNGEWRVGLYWLTAAGSGIAFPDSSKGLLLSAKVLDMDRNGTPELLLFRLADEKDLPYFYQRITAELWESDGAGGVKMTHSVDVTPAPPSDWMDMASVSLVSGSTQDYLRMENSANGVCYYAAGQEKAVKQLEYVGEFAPDNEAMMDPDYYLFFVDGVEVPEAEYQAEADRWGSGTRLVDNYQGGLPEAFWGQAYAPTGSVGEFCLDLKSELDAARTQLETMAGA